MPEPSFAGSKNQRDTCSSPMPALGRLTPIEHQLSTRRFREDHWRDQIVHQAIVFRPAADAVKPGLKQAEFLFTELARELLQHQNSKDLLFKHATGKQFVSNFENKREPKRFL